MPPGIVMSPPAERIMTPEIAARRLQQIPAGQQGTLEEIAAAVCFLAAPVGGHVTGATQARPIRPAPKIAGCALDTIDPEPLPTPHPLRGRDNVVIAPHAAWYSEEALVGLQAGAPNEVWRVLSGQWPVNVVNPAVRGKNLAGL